MHAYIDACIYTYIHIAVMCNLINIHTYTYIHTHIHTYINTYIHPREDQCEWHRMTQMTGPDCAIMCNLINIHTYIHTEA